MLKLREHAGGAAVGLAAACGFEQRVSANDGNINPIKSVQSNPLYRSETTCHLAGFGIHIMRMYTICQRAVETRRRWYR